MTGREQAWTKYVIDTNVIIDTMRGTSETVNFMTLMESREFQVLYSVIVEAELFSSQLLTEEDKKDLRQLLKLGVIVDVDSEVALKAAELRVLNRKLYERKMKLPDALIAATALLHSAVLVTRNVDDFKVLHQHGLQLYNPFS
ncbi:MAG: type II toxin-antitoxin system VapC family toxin [Bacillota bacterium]